MAKVKTKSVPDQLVCKSTKATSSRQIGRSSPFLPFMSVKKGIG